MSADPSLVVCANVQPLLSGFVGEELADRQLAMVHTHLHACLRCRRDAADYMQANKALQRAALAAVEQHDVPFDAMHAAIMARVTADDVIAAPHGSWRLVDWSRIGSLPVPRWANRLMFAAAAVLLAAFGFWLGRAPAAQSIWDRQGGVVLSEGVVVLPYAGSPADIRPVGLEAPGGVESGIQTGMSARGPYRLQVEPAVLYRPTSSPVGK